MTSLAGGNAAPFVSRPFYSLCLHRQTRDLPVASFVQAVTDKGVTVNGPNKALRPRLMVVYHEKPLFDAWNAQVPSLTRELIGSHIPRGTGRAQMHVGCAQVIIARKGNTS